MPIWRLSEYERIMSLNSANSLAAGRCRISVVRTNEFRDRAILLQLTVVPIQNCAVGKSLK